MQNKMDNLRAGILTAGETRARRISKVICNERATKPAVKRPSAIVHLILHRLLKCQLSNLQFARVNKQIIEQSLCHEQNSETT
jgi:hypothetical protein